jgi:tetratricopeptide (TPR) repeat protein
MAIRGSLREASLPDVLQLLAMGQKTGVLSIGDRSNFGYIYFDRGRISYARIVNRRDRLGDILVKNGILEQADLDEAIAIQGKERKRLLGEILIERELLTREELHHYVRVQIEEAVYYLFTWTQGTFSFEAEVTPDDQPLLVSISPESLLLEGARRVDEWSLIEKKVPGFDSIFELDRGRLTASVATLTPEEERIVPHIDGRRDVAALVDASGLSEFDAGKALYGLVTAGFAHRTGRTRPSEDVVREARVEEHRNLGIAFYKARMYDEASREFRRVGELLPNDAQAGFYLGLIAMREAQWETAVDLLRRAAAQPGATYAVFHNLSLALERLDRLDEAADALGQALELGGGDDPVTRTAVGVLALKRGELAAAETALGAARPHWGTRAPSAVWFHYAALSAALTGDLDRALALATEGTAAHPHAAVLFNTLATVQERRGDIHGATEAANRGLHEDSNLAPLHKNLGDALYRAGRYDQAIAAYERALACDASLGSDVYFKLGNIRYKRRERDEAIACWQRALAIDPGNELVRTNLDLVRTVAAS